MRKLLLIAGVLLLTIPLAAIENNHTMAPVVSEWNNDAMTIYNTGNDGSVVNGLSVYVVGSSFTATASCTVYADSVAFTTTDGLYPGTTEFVFADSDKDTLTEFYAYCLSVATYGVLGADGGIMCSTSSAAIGKTASTNLTEATAVSCLGSANAKTLTVTPAATQTSTFEVCNTSMVFVTTNGLYPGTAYISFESTHTLAWLKDQMDALDPEAAGIDGTIVAAIPTGTYELNLSTDVTEGSPQNILLEANEKTLDLDTIYGWTYITPVGISRNMQRHLTGLSVNATFGSGTAYLYVRDGTEATDTTILKYEIDTTATQTNIPLPSNGDFAGSKETQLRIDVVGSVGFTAGFMTIIGHKE